MNARCVILIVINIASILCISLLFITTRIRRIPRHPVVSTLLLTAIPRAIIAALPSFLFHDLQEKLPMSTEARYPLMAEQRTPLARFCATQATLIYFLLATQAAFCISFTVPIFLIARHSSRLVSNPSINQRLRLPSTLALCIGPFIWACPIIFLAIPTVINEPNYPTIYFSEVGYCNLDDWNYQAVSASLIALPLIFGTGIAVVAIVYIVRFNQNNKGAALRGRSLDFALLFRFAAIVFMIIVSGLFLLLEILILDDNRVRWLWALDVYWEAATPFMQFLLFASQRSLLRIWASWIHRFLTHIRVLPLSLCCSDQESSRRSQSRSDDSTMMTRYRNKTQTEGGPVTAGKTPATGVKVDEDGKGAPAVAVPVPPALLPNVETPPQTPSDTNATRSSQAPRRFLNIFRLPPPSSSLSFGEAPDSKRRRRPVEAHTTSMATSTDHTTHQYLSNNSILVDWEESDWDEDDRDEDEEADSTSIEERVGSSHGLGPRGRQEPVARLEAEISHFIGTESVPGPSTASAHGHRHRPTPRPFTLSNASANNGGNGGHDDTRGRPRPLRDPLGKGKERSLPVPPRAQSKRPTTPGSITRSDSPMRPPSPAVAITLRPSMQSPWNGPSPWSIPRTVNGNGLTAAGSSSSQPGSSTAVDDTTNVDEETLVLDGITVSPARRD